MTEDVVVHDDEEREKALVDYRGGGEGFARWCEDFVRLEIYPYDQVYSEWVPMKDLPAEPHPKTGKTYRHMWEEQKKIMRGALRMEDKRFVNRQIVFCWMRGEGKSVDAVLIQLWKFFCWTRQKIMLGANSRDQIKFVHYDIMRDIIWNSPELYRAVGKKNIQEKEIRMTNRYKEITSIIRSISSFTGILSNITGYTFSEMFDMKNPKFYTQLDGSIRNVPNALGVIDSTVSDKSHVLYQLFDAYTEKKTRAVFFSHRQSPLGVPEDYWNPNMDEDQLNDYKVKFPLGLFERYFLNTWEAGRVVLFDERMVEESGYIGMNGALFNHEDLEKSINDKLKKKQTMQGILDKGFTEGAEKLAMEISIINDQFTPVENYYQILFDPVNLTSGASLYDLQQLGERLDTDWAVLAGIDFADPMAILKKARTVYTLIAKGLPGSRTNPYVFDIQNAALKYVYFLIRMVDVTDHTVNVVKEQIERDHEQIDGIDTLCCERYGSWDLINWCDDREIKFEPVFPSFNKQREAFKEFYTVMNEGRFKRPRVPITGVHGGDIFEEEADMFEHDPDKKWFGSPEKSEKKGVQDDSIYSISWGIFGGWSLTPADLRPRNVKHNFGVMVEGGMLLGKY